MSTDATHAQNLAISLREVTDEDVAIFYEFQQDPVANHMVAFTARNRSEWDAFLAHWTRIRANKNGLLRTVLLGDCVVGNMLQFELEGHQEVGYWIDRVYWGRGIASQALQQFLQIIPVRPLYGYCAKDNFASVRVLQKCGFESVGESREFSPARGVDVEQHILVLHA